MLENVQIHYVRDFSFLREFWSLRTGEWTGPAYSGLDIETEGHLNPHDGHVACVQIEFDGHCWVVHWDAGTSLDAVYDVCMFRKYLQEPKVTKVIHNSAFEHKWFYKHLGKTQLVEPVWDTMAAEYNLAEGSGFDEDNIKINMSMFSLDTVVLRRYGYEMDKDKALRTGFRRRYTVETVPPKLKGGIPMCSHPGCDQEAHLKVGSKGIALCADCVTDDAYKRIKTATPIVQADYLPSEVMHEDLSDRQKQYAALDAVAAARICADQIAEMTEIEINTGRPVFALAELDFKAAEAIGRMELKGVFMDTDHLIRLHALLTYEEERLREDIQTALWMDSDVEPVNIASGDQMVPRLAEFGIIVPSYEGPELKHFEGIRVVDDLLEWKKTQKLLSTYSGPLLEKTHPVTGGVHCSFNQFQTGTGRLSSSGPNLQNIPARTPLGREIRKAFMARPGHKIIQADYSQIELRLISEMFNDPNMKRAFNDGMDVHSMMAAQILGISYEEFLARLEAGDEDAKDARTAAKPANFGLGYGAGVNQLIVIAWTQYGLAWTYEYAAKIHAAYHGLWTGVSAYHKKIGWEIKNGFGSYTVETQSGRRRRMPREWIAKSGKDKGKRKTCYAAAMNMPIQGTSADMIKEVMGVVCRELDLILQVHDELVFEVPEADAEWAAEYVKYTMEAIGQTYLKEVPCIADVKVGDRWSK